MTGDAHILYKVVEVAPVAEDTVERTLNDRAREGWGFESIHFVMREGSHRPAMAYLFFTRVREEAAQDRTEGRADRSEARPRSVPAAPGRRPRVDDHA